MAVFLIPQLDICKSTCGQHGPVHTVNAGEIRKHKDNCLRGSFSEKSHRHHFHFQNVFYPHKNAKPMFSNSSGLKTVFEKLPFRLWLVWTKIKLRFQNSPAKCGRRLKTYSSEAIIVCFKD